MKQQSHQQPGTRRGIPCRVPGCGAPSVTGKLPFRCGKHEHTVVAVDPEDR